MSVCSKKGVTLKTFLVILTIVQEECDRLPSGESVGATVAWIFTYYYRRQTAYGCGKEDAAGHWGPSHVHIYSSRRLFPRTLSR